MGSTLPLVEIRLRMGPRSTVVVRTLKGPGRVKTGIRASAASTPSASQVRPLRVAGLPFELLLVAANRLSFRVRRGQLQRLIYHSEGHERMPSAQAVAWLDAAGGRRMPERVGSEPVGRTPQQVRAAMLPYRHEQGSNATITPCQNSAATRASTPPPGWTPSFLRSKPGRTSFQATR